MAITPATSGLVFEYLSDSCFWFRARCAHRAIFFINSAWWLARWSWLIRGFTRTGVVTLVRVSSGDVLAVRTLL